MKEKQELFLIKLFIVIDVVIALGCFMLSYHFQDTAHYLYRGIFKGDIQYTIINTSIKNYLWVPIVGIPLLITVLYFNGIYEPYKRITTTRLLFDEFLAAFAVSILVSWIIFTFKIEHVNRFFLFLFLFTSTSLIFLEKSLLLCFPGFVRKKGLNRRHILIVGSSKRATNCIRTIKSQGETREVEVIGIIDDDRVGDTIEGIKVLGSLSDIKHIARKHVIDQVIYVIPRSWLIRIEESVLFCEMLGIKVAIAVDFFDMLIARGNFTNISGIPIIEFSTTPGGHLQLFVKRCLDILVSLSLLTVGFPLFVTIALLVKYTSPGSILFKQKRMGINGRIFDFYKFRSMVVNAETKLKELKEFNEMGGPVFKIKEDPRITKVGKYLRKLSLDELPQLWNVLLGEMSLVGPRPPIPDEVDLYDHWHRRRLSVKPGLTCLWQVSGRNEITKFEDWMILDLEYIDSWSLMLDLKILLKTIPVLLLCKGSS